LRVVITGAAGFVGLNLLESLKDSEFDIIPCDIVDIKDVPIPFTKLDITNADSVKKVVKGSDIIVHLAAHQLMSSFSDILQNAQVNIMGTLNLLEAARLYDLKKFIFTSASSIVGVTKYNPVDEKHPCTPKTPYGVAKLAVEHYLRIYQENYGLDYLIFRFFNIYGPYQTTGLIPTIYKRLITNSPIDVYGNGSQVRDYVYIKDAMQFFRKAITENIKNDVVNIGTGTGTTVLEVINMASEILKIKPQLNFHPAGEGEIDNFVANVELLRNLFGSVPNTSVKEGLKKTFNWLSSQEKQITT